jgi:hypothetical protein
MPELTAKFSDAFFFGVGLDATVPLLSFAPERAGKARGLAQVQLNLPFRLASRSYPKSRLRSHPEVPRACYAGPVPRRNCRETLPLARPIEGPDGGSDPSPNRRKT